MSTHEGYEHSEEELTAAGRKLGACRKKLADQSEEIERLHRELAEARAELEDKRSDSECLWQQDYVGGEYETSCSRSFMFQDDSNLEDNDFKFCPFCGGKIIPNEPTDKGDECD